MFAVLQFSDFLIIALLLMLFVGGSAAFRPSDQARLRRIERKLDFLLRHLNIEFPDPATAAGLSEQVRGLADDGKKIEAIKLHREQTGLGLKEAKDAIESYVGKRE